MATIKPAIFSPHEGTDLYATPSVITETKLGTGDSGFGRITFELIMKDWEGSQAFGGASLSVKNQDTGLQMGTDYGMEIVIQVLRVVGVPRWEELCGKRVLTLRKIPFSRIVGIANIDNPDKFLILDMLIPEANSDG